MLKFYTLITGDNYTQLKNETPASIKKVKLYGMIIFLPVIIWCLSAYSIGKEVLDLDNLSTLVLMFSCSVIIFLIERSIIMSNGSKVIAAVRIVIGLLVSALGSIALDEAVFKNDINTQINENKDKYVNERTEILNQQLQKRSNDLSLLVSEKDSLLRQSRHEVLIEANGSGGTEQRGAGKITKLKMDLSAKYQLEYETAKNDHEKFISGSDSIRNAEKEKIAAGFDEKSLLLRTKALFDLVSKDKMMMMIYIVFTLLIIFLESIVILVKMFSKETSFEKRIWMIEEISKRRMDQLASNNPAVIDDMIFRDVGKSKLSITERPLPGIFN